MKMNVRRALFLPVVLFALLFPTTVYSQDAVDEEEQEVTYADSEYAEQLAAKDEFFVLDPLLDSLLLAGGIGSSVGYKVWDWTSPLASWDGTSYDLSDVNAFDRWAAQPYSKALDITGTVTCGIDLALPVLAFGLETAFSQMSLDEAATVAVMYAESFTLSYGIKGLVKRSVQRVRPYMYFDNPDADSVLDGDYTLSFPSGHTTNAFMGATFVSYVFASMYPDSAWKIPVIAASYSLAVGTGVLRMLSGNHFLTDVLTGAVLGSACGFLVPFAHHLVASGKSSSSSSAKKHMDTEIAVLPGAVSFTLYF